MENKPLYKAIDMEEKLDIIFFHPAGYQIAVLAKPLGMTPDQISYISMALGVAGGFMLSSWNTAFTGWLLIIMSSVFDSADGQLARMTGGGSLRGRILDGMIGYFTFTAAYVGLLALNLRSPDSLGWTVMLPLALAGGAFTAFESSMYDFYRTTFAGIVSKRHVPDDAGQEELGWFFKMSYAGYGVYQKFFAASHLRLLNLVRARYPDQLPSEFCDDYRATNRYTVHFWNLLGDNTRFLLIGVCLILHRPQWYFFFIIGPLLFLMIAMALVQRGCDRKMISHFKLEETNA
jgi:hypothetical protein